MSARIYSIPDQFKTSMPSCWDDSIEDYQEAEKQWIVDLQDFIRRSYGLSQYVGRTISFPVADGSAMYMVMSLGAKPELLHLPLMDAYEFGYAHLMTASEIKKEIDTNDEFNKYLVNNFEIN